MMIVNLLGILLIIAIVWWFWMYKPAEVLATPGELLVTVENGVYQPARLSIPSGQQTTIKFLRKEESPCSSTVVFADLNISEELPVNKTVSIDLPPLTSGHYSFTCQMQMYRGELVVSDQTV